MSDVVGDALPVEPTSPTLRTNNHGTKTGLPPRKAGGKRGACEYAPDLSGNGRWAGRREVGRLNPRRETKIQGVNGEVSEGKTDL